MRGLWVETHGFSKAPQHRLAVWEARRSADRPLCFDRRGREPPGPFDNETKDLRPRMERVFRPRRAKRSHAGPDSIPRCRHTS